MTMRITSSAFNGTHSIQRLRALSVPFTLQSQLACLANPACSRQVGNMRLHGPRRSSVRHALQCRPKRLLLAAHSPFHLAPCRARVAHRLYRPHVYVESQ